MRHCHTDVHPDRDNPRLLRPEQASRRARRSDTLGRLPVDLIRVPSLPSPNEAAANAQAHLGTPGSFVCESTQLEEELVFCRRTP
jgi:hypothetical protein